MRLNPREREVITEAAVGAFAPGTTVFLFGSRVDDRKRGGDLDLLVETPGPMTPAETVARRTRFVALLYRMMGEQRIDIVITSRGRPDPRPIVAIARRTGVPLAQI